MEQAIISRVRALFAIRGVSQREFAEAIGRDPSWVSSFFSGKRPANDIHLLLRIARFYGVTVGYLLNETERGRDAGTTTLIATYTDLDERAKRVVLNTALMLKDQTADSDTRPSPGSAAAPSPEGGTTKGRAKRR